MDNLFADETILARWLNKELTEAELKTLQEHEAYADLQAIVEEVDQLELKGEERDAAADYALLKERIEQESAPKKKAKLRRIAVYRWAAAIAILCIAFAGWSWFSTRPLVYVTQAGERQEIDLPDGSQVLLNSVSELKVYTKDWDKRRQLNLSGEAFFKVRKGNPFVIYTSAGQVEVIGTEFNVYARNDILESLCTSGTIRTSSVDGSISQTSEAGQGVRLLNNQLALTFDVSPETIQWPDGQSHFESVPYDRVIAELERQFSVDIQYNPNLFADSDAFNGWFNNQNLDEALRNVFVPIKIKYEKNQEVILLSR